MKCTRAEICATAVADAFRGDGEILASAFGTVPDRRHAAREAHARARPDDDRRGLPSCARTCPRSRDPRAASRRSKAGCPFRSVFDLLWSGRRHVIMTASQIDRFGNHNFACIGDFTKPKAQLLGMRGAPGNTISHPTSYWVPRPLGARVRRAGGRRVRGRLRPRAPSWARVARFHEIRRVVSNLGVFDFETPDQRMRLANRPPGRRRRRGPRGHRASSSRSPTTIEETRAPNESELALIRERARSRGPARARSACLLNRGPSPCPPPPFTLRSATCWAWNTPIVQTGNGLGRHARARRGRVRRRGVRIPRRSDDPAAGRRARAIARVQEAHEALPSA